MGTPTTAPTTVKLRITPTISNTNPKIAPTNLPVNSMISANKRQITQNGHKYQGICFLSLAISTSFNKYEIRMTWLHNLQISTRIQGFIFWYNIRTFVH